MELVCRLDLDDQLVVDDHVEPLVGELFTLVHDTNADFPPYLMTATSELSLQRHHINVLEKAEAECVVNLEKRADYGASQLLFDQVGSFHDRRSPQNIRRAQPNHCTRNQTISE